MVESSHNPSGNLVNENGWTLNNKKFLTELGWVLTPKFFSFSES